MSKWGCPSGQLLPPPSGHDLREPCVRVFISRHFIQIAAADEPDFPRGAHNGVPAEKNHPARASDQDLRLVLNFTRRDIAPEAFGRDMIFSIRRNKNLEAAAEHRIFESNGLGIIAFVKLLKREVIGVS